MTDDQLRKLIHEEIIAAVQPLRDEFSGSLQTLRDELRAELRERLDAAVVSIGTDFSELRTEVAELRADMRRHVESLERRFESLAQVVYSVDSRMASLTRATNLLESQHLLATNTQTAQQRAIDDLAARVSKLERAVYPPER